MDILPSCYPHILLPLFARYKLHYGYHGGKTNSEGKECETKHDMAESERLRLIQLKIFIGEEARMVFAVQSPRETSFKLLQDVVVEYLKKFRVLL